MVRKLAAALCLIAAPAAAQDRVATEQDGSRTLVSEAWMPVQPAAVWQAVSTAEGWKRWAVRNAWATPGDPTLIETSYQAEARQGDAANIQQRFVAQLPGRLLVFRTVRTPPGFPHAEEFLKITQFLELSEEAGGTRVRLTGVNYPAGSAGDQLLDFFKTGNRSTLDNMAATLSLVPLDFLTGHCWQGTLPNGDVDKHCFKAMGNEVRDHHDVTRKGQVIYAGDTSYALADRAVAWTYTNAKGGVMKGNVRRLAHGLDFGTAEYAGKDGTKIVIRTEWRRIANGYEVRESSPAPAHNRTTQYLRVD